MVVKRNLWALLRVGSARRIHRVWNQGNF